MWLAPTLSMITLATVDFPEPVPPAIPITRGGVRFGMKELYWKTAIGGSRWSARLRKNCLFNKIEPPKGIEPLT